jgi:hypothetical protein
MQKNQDTNRMNNLSTALCMACIILLVGCLPADTVEITEPVKPTKLAEHTRGVSDVAVTPSPEIINTPSIAVINQPTITNEEDLSGDSNLDLPESEGMPVFVEMTQTTIVVGSDSDDMKLNVGSDPAFDYNSDTRTLFLQPTQMIDPAAEVLIGLSTILKLPDVGFVKGELFQIPLSAHPPLTIVAVDQKTGNLTIDYNDEIFRLMPGQSRSFKKTGSDPQQPTLIITVTNHGRPATIETFPEDNGWR